MSRVDASQLRKLAKSLKKQPTVLAQRIAARVAPELTRLAGSSYDSGRTVYGTARPLGTRGNALDLVEGGRTRDSVKFVAVGTIVRAVLSTPWARYLVGKYRILPMGNMPTAWQESIHKIANVEFARHYGEGASS